MTQEQFCFYFLSCRRVGERKEKMAWVGSRTRARPVVPEGFSLTPLLCPNFIIDVQAAAKRQTETRYGRTLARRTCDPGASRRSSAPKGRGAGCEQMGIREWEGEHSRPNYDGCALIHGRQIQVIHILSRCLLLRQSSQTPSSDWLPGEERHWYSGLARWPGRKTAWSAAWPRHQWPTELRAPNACRTRASRARWRSLLRLCRHHGHCGSTSAPPWKLFQYRIANIEPEHINLSFRQVWILCETKGAICSVKARVKRRTSDETNKIANSGRPKLIKFDCQRVKRRSYPVEMNFELEH